MKRHWSQIAAAGVGAGVAVQGPKEYEKYMLGRQIAKRMQQQREMREG